MADNKKSFVLYCDLLHTVEKLPNEKAGELFKHILRYVNDLNPETDDILIDAVFEGVKQQLKRDLVKYEEKRKQRSEAGKKSAELRAKKRSTKPTTVKSRSTNPTVNDNVTVNVNDILNKLVKDLHPSKVSVFKKWVEYRKEIKKPLKVESTVKALIKKFNSNPIKMVEYVVDNSIENNWAGLFWEKYTEEDKPAEYALSSKPLN
jgi:hypothetical protein